MRKSRDFEIGKRPFVADGYDPTQPNNIYIDSRLIKWMLDNNMYASQSAAINHYIYWSICYDERNGEHFTKSEKKIADDLGVSSNAVVQTVKRTTLFYRLGNNGDRHRGWALGPRPKYEPKPEPIKTESKQEREEEAKPTTPYLAKIHKLICIENLPKLLMSVGTTCAAALLRYKGIEHGQYQIEKILDKMPAEQLEYCKSVNVLADQFTGNLPMTDWITMFPIFADVNVPKLKNEKKHIWAIQQCIADLQLPS